MQDLYLQQRIVVAWATDNVPGTMDRATETLNAIEGNGKVRPLPIPTP